MRAQTRPVMGHAAVAQRAQVSFVRIHTLCVQMVEQDLAQPPCPSMGSSVLPDHCTNESEIPTHVSCIEIENAISKQDT
jgi:hypothetical protein